MSSSIFGGAQDTTDARNAQSGHSNNVAGSFSSSATDSAVALGGGAKLEIKNQAAGAYDLAGNKGQVGGVSVSGKGAKLSTADNSVTNITTSDPGVAQLAISATSTLAYNFGKSLSDYVTKTTQSSAAAQSHTLDALASLSEKQTATTATSADAKAASDATGGLSNFQKTFLWLGLALLGVVAIFFWKRKN